MTRKANTKPLKAPGSGAPVSREEIKEILVDQGYSAGEREEWLKSVLTDLSAKQVSDATPERERLISEIKEIVNEHQKGKPLSDDVL